MQKIKWNLLILSLLIFTAFHRPAHAASAEVEKLKQDVQWLKNSVENSNTKLAEAMNQLSTIQQELNTLKGSSESGGYFFQEQTRSLKEYDQRITALEDKIGIQMNLLKEIKETPTTSSGAKPTGMDETQVREFQKNLDFINSEDYPKALQGFQAFVQKYPKSPMMDNAQFWIAESYYGLNDFKKAIAEYQNLIQKFPRSTKIKTALLKQGQSFVGLKMLAEARPFFEKIISDYPNTAEAAKASVRLKELDKGVTTGTVESRPSPASTNPTPGVPLTPSQNPRPVSGGIY
ncbi:MAG: tol-pal system protein YbgF [Deltaproteobacteria bacterium]|nr:tol-pal system protein YbgF [Deltaproteobacteria bacterium]